MQSIFSDSSFPDGVGPLLLSNARLADGRMRDVILEDGRIAVVAPPGEVPMAARTINLEGYMLLPSLVEPHCHFDKIFTDALIGAPAGDVIAASRSWHAFRRTIDFDAVAERAMMGIEVLAGNGVTAIRTHVDVGRDSGIRFVETMAVLRRRLIGKIDLQIVAFVDNPLVGEEGATNRRMLEASLEFGADLIGGAPYQNPDPVAFLTICLDLAQRYGCGIDLHMDETTDAHVFTLPQLLLLVRQMRFSQPVAASHCVSLGTQDPTVVEKIAAELFDAGMSIITLPLCNLFLQGRGDVTNKPRGLAPLPSLIGHGIAVAAGGDNYQDPFNPVGRCDPLEIASLLVTAGHLSPEEAVDCVTKSARQVMGLPAVDLVPDSPADLLAIRAHSLREAIATANAERMVFRAGRLIASAFVQRMLRLDDGSA
jgi:cytosine deaminase